MSSIRIVSIDYYMSYPTQDLDIKYSEFRGTEVKQVPVIQVYGSSQKGHKTCVNIHGVFPYIYIPYDGKEPAGNLSYKIAAELDKALNTSLRQSSSNAIHIHNIVLVSGIPLYGYHERKHQFFKVYFYNPGIISTACALLENGAILGTHFQPHERHINYILQFMIDYNLHGMSFMNISHAMYRVNPKDPDLLDDVPPDLILPNSIQRRSVCTFEMDVQASCITNKNEISDGELTANPGIKALWEDEKQRRRDKNMDSQISFCLTQERILEIQPTLSHTFFEERLAEKLSSQFRSDDTTLDLEQSVYPAETPDNADLLNASTVDHSFLDSTLLDETIRESSVNFNEEDWKLLKMLQEMKQNANVEDDSILSQQVIAQEALACDEVDLNLSQPLQMNVQEDDVWEDSYWEDCPEIPSQVPQVDGQFDTDSTGSYHSDGYFKLDDLDPVVHQSDVKSWDNYRIASEVYIDRHNMSSPDIPDDKKLNPGVNKLILTERHSAVPDASKIKILSDVFLKSAEISEELRIEDNKLVILKTKTLVPDVSENKIENKIPLNSIENFEELMDNKEVFLNSESMSDDFDNKEVIINDVNLASSLANTSRDIQKCLDAITFEAVTKSNPNSRAQSPCSFYIFDEFLPNSIDSQVEELTSNVVKRKRGRPKKLNSQENKNPSKNKVDSSKDKKTKDTPPPDTQFKYNLRLSDSLNSSKACSGCSNYESTNYSIFDIESIDLDFQEESYVFAVALENKQNKVEKQIIEPKVPKKTANKPKLFLAKDKNVKAKGSKKAKKLKSYSNKIVRTEIYKVYKNSKKTSKVKAKKRDSVPKKEKAAKNKKQDQVDDKKKRKSSKTKEKNTSEKDTAVENKKKVNTKKASTVSKPTKEKANKRKLSPERDKILETLLNQPNHSYEVLNVVQNVPPDEILENQNENSPQITKSAESDVILKYLNSPPDTEKSTEKDCAFNSKETKNKYISTEPAEKIPEKIVEHNSDPIAEVQQILKDKLITEDKPDLIDFNYSDKSFEQIKNIRNENNIVPLSPEQLPITEEIVSTDTLDGNLQFQDSFIIKSIETNSDEAGKIIESVNLEKTVGDNQLSNSDIDKLLEEYCDTNINDLPLNLIDVSTSKPTDEINSNNQNMELSENTETVNATTDDVMPENVDNTKHDYNNQNIKVIGENEDKVDIPISKVFEEFKHNINQSEVLHEKFVQEDAKDISRCEEMNHESITINAQESAKENVPDVLMAEDINDNNDLSAQKNAAESVLDASITSHDINQKDEAIEDKETVKLAEENVEAIEDIETVKPADENDVAIEDKELVKPAKEQDREIPEAAKEKCVVNQNKESIEDNETVLPVKEDEQKNIPIPEDVNNCDKSNEQQNIKAINSSAEDEQQNVTEVSPAALIEQITVLPVKEDDQKNIPMPEEVNNCDKSNEQQNIEAINSSAEDEQQNVVEVSPAELIKQITVLPVKEDKQKNIPIPKDVNNCDKSNEQQNIEAINSSAEDEQQNIVEVSPAELIEQISEMKNGACIKQDQQNLLQFLRKKVAKKNRDCLNKVSREKAQQSNLLFEHNNNRQSKRLQKSRTVKITGKDQEATINTSVISDENSNCDISKKLQKTESITSFDKNQETTLPNGSKAIKSIEKIATTDILKTNNFNNNSIIKNKNNNLDLPISQNISQTSGEKRKYKIQINCKSTHEFDLVKAKLLQWKVDDRPNHIKTAQPKKLITLRSLDGQADSPSSDSGMSQEESTSKKVEETKNTKKRARKNKMACRSPGLSKISVKKINRKKTKETNAETKPEVSVDQSKSEPAEQITKVLNPDNVRPLRHRTKSWKLRSKQVGPTENSNDSTKSQENEEIQPNTNPVLKKELRVVLIPLESNSKKVHFFSDTDDASSDHSNKEIPRVKSNLTKHKLMPKITHYFNNSSTDSLEEQPDKKIKTDLPSSAKTVISLSSSSDEKPKSKPKKKSLLSLKKKGKPKSTTNVNRTTMICSSSSDEKIDATPVKNKSTKVSRLTTKKPIDCTETLKNSESAIQINLPTTELTNGVQLNHTETKPTEQETPLVKPPKILETKQERRVTRSKLTETEQIKLVVNSPKILEKDEPIPRVTRRKLTETEQIKLVVNSPKILEKEDEPIPRVTRRKLASSTITSSNGKESNCQTKIVTNEEHINIDLSPEDLKKNLVVSVEKLTPDQISSGSSIEVTTQAKAVKKITKKTAKYSPLNVVRSPRKHRNLEPHEFEPITKRTRSNVEGIEPIAKTNKKKPENKTSQGTGELKKIPFLLEDSSGEIKTPFSIKKRLFNLEDLNVTSYEEFKTCSYESSPNVDSHLTDYDITIDINYLRNLRRKEEQFLAEINGNNSRESSPVKDQHQHINNNISSTNNNNLDTVNVFDALKNNIKDSSKLNSQHTPLPVRNDVKKKDKNPVPPSKYKTDPGYVFFTPKKKSFQPDNIHSPGETLSQQSEKELIHIDQFNTKINNLTVAEEYDLRRDFAPQPSTSRMPSEHESPNISFTYNDISLMDNTELCTQNLPMLDESVSYNTNSSRIWMPKYFPPTKEDIESTLATYNIPEHRFQEPYYSDYSDVTGKVDIGNNVLKISSNTAADLDEFESCTGFCGIEKWRKNEFTYMYPTETVCKNLKVTLAGHKKIVIMPVNPPPTRNDIKEWIKTKNSEIEDKILATKMEKLRILVPQSPGNSNDSFNESLTLSPFTPERSNIIESSQTPVTSLNSPVVSRRRSLRKRENLQRKVLFTNQEEKLKLIDPSENLSSNDSCQITGVTLNNTHGFQMSFENLQDAKAVTEHQYLTILVLELHIRTRGDFYPDPQYDSIRAIFYSILNDVPEDFYLPREETGIIAVDTLPGSPAKQTASILDGTGVKSKITYVKSELDLVEEFIKLIRKWDPDIFTGFEIEMLSWGYLIDRCYVIGINLPVQISRINPDIIKNKQQPEKQEELKLPGRIVLDAWRLFRHEIALQSYTFENLMYHILHQRVPAHSFKNLSFCWEYRSNYFRHITANYYITRVEGVLKLLDQLDLIGRTSELARLFGIQFYEVLSRGSQFRVESMMLRLAKPLNYIPVSPSVQQRAKMRAPEWVPLILEPESRFYIDPVIVLDFQSLYPSIIIAYNYCFSTCIGRVENLGTNSPFEFGACQLKIPRKGLEKIQDNINFSPCGVGFVKPAVRKGILPRMLTEILETRLMVKSSMKENKDDKLLQRVLHSRQLGLKLIANVTYGYTSANFSGRMPCIEIGDSVVSKGRETLERAIKLIERTEKWRARVVYGDTDSLFVLVPGRSREQAFEIGAEIAEAVTNDNPPPVKLKLEKVYQPCILQTKKRYVGYMYESPGQTEPEYNAKGIETVRRDGCPAVAKMLEKTLRLLFETRDLSLVKKYTVRQFEKLMTGRASFQDLIFAREFRGFSGYRPGACVPALELAKRWTAADKRREPRRNERVPYIIVHGPPGVPLIRLVRSPMELMSPDQSLSLRPNAVYYVTRVIAPPLNRCLGLIGVDVQAWFNEMPRKQLQILPTDVHFEKSKKSTISQYFATMSCVVCNKQTRDGLCEDCCRNPQQSVVVLQEKLGQWERAYDDVVQICQSCCGRAEYTECVSLDCPVLYRLNQVKRDLKHVPFVRNLLSKFS